MPLVAELRDAVRAARVGSALVDATLPVLATLASGAPLLSLFAGRGTTGVFTVAGVFAAGLVGVVPTFVALVALDASLRSRVAAPLFCCVAALGCATCGCCVLVFVFVAPDGDGRICTGTVWFSLGSIVNCSASKPGAVTSTLTGELARGTNAVFDP